MLLLLVSLLFPPAFLKRCSLLKRCSSMLLSRGTNPHALVVAIDVAAVASYAVEAVRQFHGVIIILIVVIGVVVEFVFALNARGGSERPAKTGPGGVVVGAGGGDMSI